MSAPIPADLFERAACKDLVSATLDPWHPTGKGQSYKYARRICNGCEVRALCLRAALNFEGDTAEGLRHGLFGGKTPAERALMAGASTKNVVNLVES